MIFQRTFCVFSAFVVLCCKTLAVTGSVVIAEGECKGIEPKPGRRLLVYCQIPSTNWNMKLRAVVKQNMGPKNCTQGENYLIGRFNLWLVVEYPCQGLFKIEDISNTSSPGTAVYPLKQTTIKHTVAPSPRISFPDLSGLWGRLWNFFVPATTARPSVGSKGKCGLPNSSYRVVGGTKSGNCQYPWMVVVYNRNNGRLCGGSILDDLTVLTASHCLVHRSGFGIKRITPAKDLLILSGSAQMPFARSNYRQIEGLRRTKVAKVIVHAKFDVPKNSLANDIALVKLREPLPQDQCHRPVCMLDTLTQPQKGRSCVTMGWGVTSNAYGARVQEHMRWTNVKVATQPQCKDTYYSMSTDKTFCAGADGHDSCQGDSGGPLLCREGGRYYQHGVVSAGYEGQCGRMYGLYTKVSSYLSWIEENRN